MSKPPRGAYKRWVLALISVSAVLCTVIAGRILLKGNGLTFPFFTREADASKPAVSVEYRTEYLKCGDALVEHREFPADELNSAIASLPAAWTLAGDDEKGVRLLRRIDEYCDTHYRCRLITIYRGYVCVFRGKQPDPRFLIREPGIPEVDLAERDRIYLKSGYLIEAEPDIPPEDVPAYLDGMVYTYVQGIAGMKEH